MAGRDNIGDGTGNLYNTRSEGFSVSGNPMANMAYNAIIPMMAQLMLGMQAPKMYPTIGGSSAVGAFEGFYARDFINPQHDMFRKAQNNATGKAVFDALGQLGMSDKINSKLQASARAGDFTGLVGSAADIGLSGLMGGSYSTAADTIFAGRHGIVGNKGEIISPIDYDRQAQIAQDAQDVNTVVQSRMGNFTYDADFGRGWRREEQAKSLSYMGNRGAFQGAGNGLAISPNEIGDKLGGMNKTMEALSELMGSKDINELFGTLDDLTNQQWPSLNASSLNRLSDTFRTLKSAAHVLGISGREMSGLVQTMQGNVSQVMGTDAGAYNGIDFNMQSAMAVGGYAKATGKSYARSAADYSDLMNMALVSEQGIGMRAMAYLQSAGPAAGQSYSEALTSGSKSAQAAAANNYMEAQFGTANRMRKWMDDPVLRNYMDKNASPGQVAKLHGNIMRTIDREFGERSLQTSVASTDELLSVAYDNAGLSMSTPARATNVMTNMMRTGGDMMKTPDEKAAFATLQRAHASALSSGSTPEQAQQLVQNLVQSESQFSVIKDPFNIMFSQADAMDRLRTVSSNATPDVAALQASLKTTNNARQMLTAPQQKQLDNYNTKVSSAVDYVNRSMGTKNQAGAMANLNNLGKNFDTWVASTSAGEMSKSSGDTTRTKQENVINASRGQAQATTAIGIANDQNISAGAVRQTITSFNKAVATLNDPTADFDAKHLAMGAAMSMASASFIPADMQKDMRATIDGDKGAASKRVQSFGMGIVEAVSGAETKYGFIGSADASAAMRASSGTIGSVMGEAALLGDLDVDMSKEYAGLKAPMMSNIIAAMLPGGGGMLKAMGLDAKTMAPMEAAKNDFSDKRDNLERMMSEDATGASRKTLSKFTAYLNAGNITKAEAEYDAIKGSLPDGMASAAGDALKTRTNLKNATESTKKTVATAYQKMDKDGRSSFAIAQQKKESATNLTNATQELLTKSANDPAAKSKIAQAALGSSPEVRAQLAKTLGTNDKGLEAAINSTLLDTTLGPEANANVQAIAGAAVPGMAKQERKALIASKGADEQRTQTIVGSVTITNAQGVTTGTMEFNNAVLISGGG